MRRAGILHRRRQAGACAGRQALIDPDALAKEAAYGRGDVHRVQPACVSITQASELGTLYSLEHIRAIGAVCREAGLGLHMDGSRFANAVAALGASPAELTWKAGVDILSFGATKNGAMGVEAIVLFDKAKADELALAPQAGGASLLQDALPRRADGGLSG